MHDKQVLIEVGHRFRQARLARDLSLDQLAQLTGISAPALSLIETGKRDPRLTTLSRIADALRLPLAGFLDPSEQGVQTEQAASVGGYDLEDYR